MIDKKQVMFDIEACIGNNCNNCSKHKTFRPLALCVNEVLKDAISLLKEQEAVEPNEWVKCSDGMPEEQESIFAKFKGTNKWVPTMFSQSSEDVRVVIVFADGTRKVSHSRTIDGKWECEKGPLKKTVTHWMPNPKLPKEGL